MTRVGIIIIIIIIIIINLTKWHTTNVKQTQSACLIRENRCVFKSPAKVSRTTDESNTSDQPQQKTLNPTTTPSDSDNIPRDDFRMNWHSKLINMRANIPAYVRF